MDFKIIIKDVDPIFMRIVLEGAKNGQIMNHDAPLKIEDTVTVEFKQLLNVNYNRTLDLFAHPIATFLGHNGKPIINN